MRDSAIRLQEPPTPPPPGPKPPGPDPDEPLPIEDPPPPIPVPPDPPPPPVRVCAVSQLIHRIESVPVMRTGVPIAVTVRVHRQP